MTMWVKLAILDSPPLTMIYLASGNLFFIWCLVRINSFNMGEYGVKITVISFVIAEHLCGLPRKHSPFILRVLRVLCFLPIASLHRAVLSFETWSLPLRSVATSARHEWDEVWSAVCSAFRGRSPTCLLAFVSSCVLQILLLAIFLDYCSSWRGAQVQLFPVCLQQSML